MTLGVRKEELHDSADDTLQHKVDTPLPDTTLPEISPPMIAFTELPDDIMFIVMSHCDKRTLGRLGSVCKRLNFLTNQDCVWIRYKQCLTTINRNINMFNKYNASVKEQCRVAEKWKCGRYKFKEAVPFTSKQMPCMQLYDDRLWISHNDVIQGYQLMPKGYPLPCRKPEITVTSAGRYRTDVSKFVCRDGMIVSGDIDGNVTAYSAYDGRLMSHYSRGHSDDVVTVDCCKNIILSGSRDASVKAWHANLPNEQALRQTINIGDRVCSLAIDPIGRSFTVGTSGIRFLPPLQVWDFDRMECLGSLGSDYKFGAGILDIQYVTSETLLTCGYDTFIRLWDLRVSYTSCVLSCEEPFDSAFYCVRSDGSDAILAGTSHYGLVQLWDKRNCKSQVQMYYVSRTTSPVYSIVFDSTYLYAALDRGIYALNFH